MRNKKKEVTDRNIIEGILKEALWCHLAMTDDDQPYVVPLNYGYRDNALYIHCATKGMKLDLIRKNPKVAFNITLNAEYLEGLLTMRYRSVNGTGKAYIIEDEQGKREALNCLTGHFGAEPVHHSPESLKTIVMIKVKIESTTCKISYMDKVNRKEKKVTGVGGVFFKCKDPEKLREWYKDHLGLNTDQYGTSFESRDSEDPSTKTYLQWSPFTDKTKYFEPSQKEFMINYRVEDLEKLVIELRKEGVEILDDIETFEYGKFVHIMDIDGNKIELWEPYPANYEKLVEGSTK